MTHVGLTPASNRNPAHLPVIITTLLPLLSIRCMYYVSERGGYKTYTQEHVLRTLSVVLHCFITYCYNRLVSLNSI